MSAAEYVVLARDPRTLALLGEVARYESLSWTRRDLEMGELRLAVANRDLTSLDLIARNTIIEVRRDNVFEFAAILRGARTYDAIAQTWALTGYDLKWFLSRRRIVPEVGLEYDSVTDVPAETAMLHYVTAHLGSPTDSRRALTTGLDGALTFLVDDDSARGNTVAFNGRYANLLTGCLVPLGRNGDLLHDLTLQPSYGGYHYAVSTPVDATAGTGAVPVIFSTGWGDVAELTYQEDYSGVANAVYVLGQGQGAARASVLVWETGSVESDFWCEDSLDSRNNATLDALEQDGEAFITAALDGAVTLEAQPLTVGGALYRTTWDVGYDVTIELPEVGVAVDRRIVEVSVALDRAQGEKVTVKLGAVERTAGRLISAALQRNNRVSVA